MAITKHVSVLQSGEGLKKKEEETGNQRLETFPKICHMVMAHQAWGRPASVRNTDDSREGGGGEGRVKTVGWQRATQWACLCVCVPVCVRACVCAFSANLVFQILFGCNWLSQRFQWRRKLSMERDEFFAIWWIFFFLDLSLPTVYILHLKKWCLAPPFLPARGIGTLCDITKQLISTVARNTILRMEKKKRVMVHYLISGRILSML